MEKDPRPRRRLARTLARARWADYETLLGAALDHGYDAVSLEPWVRGAADAAPRQLVLRHDVDQLPQSALTMAAIDERLGLRATWYFRWRTADPDVIETLRRRGHAVGLHYETLTRRMLELGVGPEGDTPQLREECRELLRLEIAAFARRFGRPRSICPHGDTRLPGVSNGVLTQGRPLVEFGVEFDATHAMLGRELGYWLTDRSGVQEAWKDGVDPHRLLADGVTPILCVTHPNNWVSGPSVWRDRLLLRRSAPARRAAERPVRLAGAGADAPPF